MCGNRQLSTPRRRMWLDHGVPDLESMSREELIAHARRQDAQITRLATELAEVTEKLAKLEHLISRNSSNSSFPFVQGRRPGWHSPAPEAAPGSARRAEEGKVDNAGRTAAAHVMMHAVRDFFLPDSAPNREDPSTASLGGPQPGQENH
jgi:hypothetical protein